MRSVVRIVYCLCLVMGLSSVSTAQDLAPEIVEAGKRVDDAFDQNLKGWARERVVPMYPSANVIVENWKFYDRGVRISIALLRSDTKADDWLADFLRHDTRAKRIEGIGDEAAVWGYADSVITFRHGRLNVSVSSSVDLNLLSQGKKENEAMNLPETAATSRLMACFINLALNGDLMKDRQIRSDTFLQRPCERELVFRRLLGEEFLKRLMDRYERSPIRATGKKSPPRS